MSVIVCNSNKVIGTLVSGTNEDFLAAAIGEGLNWHHLSQKTFWQSSIEYKKFGIPGGSMLVQAAHNAFMWHHNLKLTPDLFWYMIVHQIAMEVKQEPNKYGFMFNGDPGKKRVVKVVDNSLIYGEENDWGATIELFEEALKSEMNPDTVDLFIPTFSTTTKEDRVAVLVAFMDVVSKFFEFRVETYCGIPQFELVGTAEDYEALLQKACTLSFMFPDMGELFWGRVIDDLEKILLTAQGNVDIDFWRSFYQFNEESGGHFIDGWITHFVAFLQTEEGIRRNDIVPEPGEEDWFFGLPIKWLPNHVSTVDFVWGYMGTDIQMCFVAGVLGVGNDDGFLAPQLGFGVYEK